MGTRVGAGGSVPVPVRRWAAVRLTEGRAWVDLGTLGSDPEDARQWADHWDERCGRSWAEANPVVSVRSVSVSVIED
jgi:hypothetical protein